MSIKRVILYGVMEWILLATVTYLEVRLNIGRGWIRTLSLGSTLVFSAFFFGLYFARTAGSHRSTHGLAVAVVWIILFTVLDAIFILWFFGVSIQAYVSSDLLIGYVVMVLVGMAMPQAVRRIQGSHTPEGLV